MKNLKFALFGTPKVSVAIAEKLKSTGLLPQLVITNPDRPVGRKQIMTSSPVADWAKENSIRLLKPKKTEQEFIAELNKEEWDLFLVIAYGQILPKDLLDLPKHGSINIHYSLLPKYRGASPVEAAILNNEKQTGVTIQLMDEKMDTGPIISQSEVAIGEKETAPELLAKLNKEAGDLLIETLPKFLSGEIEPKHQNNNQASFCKKIKKEDGLIDPENYPEKSFLQYRAFKNWPGVFFFQNGKRVKVTEADFQNGKFLIKKAIIEGEKERVWTNSQ